jgi:GT2 family glycosyltransferase
MPDVSAVIVTYNARPWIERSIESIRDGVRELIVVDHGSADGTVELVRERFPEARVLERENRGFGAGNNAVRRQATTCCC